MNFNILKETEKHFQTFHDVQRQPYQLLHAVLMLSHLDLTSSEQGLLSARVDRMALVWSIRLDMS